MMGDLGLVTNMRRGRHYTLRELVTTTVGMLSLVLFASPVAAAFPTATDFDLNPVSVDTAIVVTAADLVGSFATDPDGPLDATSLDFDGATIGGVPVGSPADAGFSYIPGAGTAGEFTVDPTTVPAFAGLTPGDSVAVEVFYTVTDPGLDSDTGVLRYTVVGNAGTYDDVTFDHQGLSAGGVTAMAAVGAGDALAVVVMTAPGTVESALASYDFSAITTPPATPGAETAVAIAIDDSEATALAEDGSAATASAINGSDATVTARADSTAVASADDASSATSSAMSLSVASADATTGSVAVAVSLDSSASTATSSNGSDTLASAEDAAAAEATADDESSASATANITSNATATAFDSSTATASSENNSSTTAFAERDSVSSAEADEASISNSVARDGSAASATASLEAEALATAQDFSAADAVANDSSSADASADNQSVATSNADDGSVSSAVADNDVAATSQASGGSSIAVRSPAPVAFPEIDDDAPSSAALRLPDELVAPANTETPLPFGVSGSGGAIDRVVLDGFPEDTILSAGIEESPGVWAFAGLPPPNLSFLLPLGSTESFSLDVRINVAGGLGFAEAPMLVTVTTEATAVPTLNGYALVLLALALMLVTAMTMRGRNWI